jgi:hypothetical protein
MGEAHGAVHDRHRDAMSLDEMERVALNAAKLLRRDTRSTSGWTILEVGGLSSEQRTVVCDREPTSFNDRRYPFYIPVARGLCRSTRWLESARASTCGRKALDRDSEKRRVMEQPLWRS